MKTLKEGQLAPSFSTQTDSGEKLSLRDLRGKNVVLYFYPKDDTPGCTIEACDFRDSMSQLTRKDVTVLGVSRDPAQSHQKFKTKYKLNFPLLLDEDGKICEAYGAWQEKNMYGRTTMGIVRSTFWIGPDGKIQKIWPRVKAAGHVAQILAAISEDKASVSAKPSKKALLKAVARKKTKKKSRKN